MADATHTADPVSPTNEPGRAPSSRRQSQTRREEIYRVAVTLFLERGYDATPLSLIASELGLTKAGLYHHFRSKEQLLFAIHQDRMREGLLPIIERAEREADPATRLDRYIRDFAALMGSDPAIRLLIDETKRLEPGHVEAIHEIWRRGYRVMRRSIEELQRDGRCDPGLTPAYAAFAAIGMCAWTLYWFDHESPDALPAVADDFARIFVGGVLGPAPRPTAPPGATDNTPTRGDS